MSLPFKTLQEEFGEVVRGIRKRNRENMTVFGRRIGVHQSAISRYEAGKFLPNRSVLLILLSLASTDEERKTLNEALELRRLEEGQVVPADFLHTLDAVKEFVTGRTVVGAQKTQLDDFVRLVGSTLHAIGRVPTGLVSMLETWNEFYDVPGVHKAFDEAASYLTVRISQLGPGKVASTSAFGTEYSKAHENIGSWAIWIKCPQTGKGVNTRSTVDDERGLAAMAKAGKGGEVYCRHCRSNHKWKASNAYLRRAP